MCLSLLLFFVSCSTQSDNSATPAENFGTVSQRHTISKKQSSIPENCDLQPHFYAVDTPLPDKKKLLSLCADPTQQLLYCIQNDEDPRSVQMSYQLLGHFTDDPQIYRFLKQSLFEHTSSKIQRSILKGLTIRGLKKDDLVLLEPFLDQDDTIIQYQVAQLYKKNHLYEPLMERFYRLHPSVQRILKDLSQHQSSKKHPNSF